jgi:hypothetical protein
MASKTQTQTQTAGNLNDLTGKFWTAFNHFNETLFGGSLPAGSLVITLQRHKGSNGYFCNDVFSHRRESKKAHEIAMNPDNFGGRSDKDILSTFVHEMTHFQHQLIGKPGRGGYHNQEWTRLMLAVDLKPVSLDNPGKMTGQAVTHDIIAGGKFDQACDALLATGFAIEWQAGFAPVVAKPGKPGDETEGEGEGEDTPKSKKNKTAYECPVCRAKVWGKPGLSIVCGDCDESYAEVD